MSLPITLLVVAALLVLVSLVQRLAVRSALPASVLLATAGMLIGGAALAVVVFDAGGALGEHRDGDRQPAGRLRRRSSTFSCRCCSSSPR